MPRWTNSSRTTIRRATSDSFSLFEKNARTHGRRHAGQATHPDDVHDVPIPRLWTSQRTFQTYTLTHCTFDSVPVVLSRGHYDLKAPVSLAQLLTFQLWHKGGSATNRHSLSALVMSADAKPQVCAVPSVSRLFSTVFGHTSWKRVRVLRQTNMLEAAIIGFHSRRRPSFVAPTVLVSTQHTKSGPTCLFCCQWCCAASCCLPRSGNAEAAKFFISRKLCHSWTFMRRISRARSKNKVVLRRSGAVAGKCGTLGDKSVENVQVRSPSVTCLN